MALSDDDKKEVGALMRAEFGLEEGQKLTDVLAKASSDAVNASINAYDRRAKKEREKLESDLKGVSDALAAIKESGTPPPAPNPSDDGSDISKLPAPMRARIEAMEKSNKELAKTVEAERAARQEQETKAAEQAKKQADRDLRDHLRSVGVSKPIGIEADAMELVIGYLHGDRTSRGEESLIRRTESGTYEMLTGKNKFNGEPEWKPVEEGMREWVKTPLGKRMLPPLPGNGTPNVTTTPGTPNGGVDLGNPNVFQGMGAKQIREAAKNITSVS